MSLPKTEFEFQDRLQNAIAERDVLMLNRLEKLTEQNPSFRPLWEEHQFLENAVARWKHRPFSDSDRSFAKSVCEQLNHQKDAGAITSTISASSKWAPLIGKNRFRAMHFAGLAAACLLLLLSMVIFRAGPESPTDVHSGNGILADIETPPAGEPSSSDRTIIKDRKEKRQRFGDLLENAGSSYGALIEATADSVQQGKDLLPTVEHLTANVNSGFRKSFWQQWTESESQPVLSPDADEKSSLKERFRSTWESISPWESNSQEPGRG